MTASPIADRYEAIERERTWLLQDLAWRVRQLSMEGRRQLAEAACVSEHAVHRWIYHPSPEVFGPHIRRVEAALPGIEANHGRKRHARRA